MNSYRYILCLIVLLGFVVNSCQKPERDNYWDELASYDPEAWAPFNLVLSVNGANTITLDWDQEKVVEGFRIERQAEGENWQEIIVLAAKERQYIDESVVLPTIYTYRLHAFAGKNTSSFVEIKLDIPVYNPITGRIWMDRNLGASRAAQSITDAEAYGDLYQWGRLSDGHQNRSSGATFSISSSDVPGHSNLILASISPWDWRSPQNDNLWQGVSGTNNPCPAGYRLPTEMEWEAERQSWSSNDANGAFNSPLKLSAAGYRNRSNGSLNDAGSYGYYWSATVSDAYARNLYFYSNNAYIINSSRALGYSVRCIKD